jgi:hypothetical protein
MFQSAKFVEVRMDEKAERGRPRKLSEDHRLFSLRLDSNLHQQLLVYAAAQRRSLNDVLVEVIENWWHLQPERAMIVRLTESATPAAERRNKPKG